MIWTSTSGITINSSERPNIVCGSSRLIGLRWWMSSVSGSKPGVLPRTGAKSAGASAAKSAAVATMSLGLECIASAPDGLQITGVARVGLDLAAQPGHLHIDVAD